RRRPRWSAQLMSPAKLPFNHHITTTSRSGSFQKGVLPSMAGKNTAAFGIYRTRADAERGVDILIENGFRNEDISVLLPENAGTKDFAHEKNTKAPEGVTTGASAG